MFKCMGGNLKNDHTNSKSKPKKESTYLIPADAAFFKLQVES